MSGLENNTDVYDAPTLETVESVSDNSDSQQTLEEQELLASLESGNTLQDLADEAQAFNDAYDETTDKNSLTKEDKEEYKVNKEILIDFDAIQKLEKNLHTLAAEKGTHTQEYADLYGKWEKSKKDSDLQEENIVKDEVVEEPQKVESVSQFNGDFQKLRGELIKDINSNNRMNALKIKARVEDKVMSFVDSNLHSLEDNPNEIKQAASNLMKNLIQKEITNTFVNLENLKKEDLENTIQFMEAECANFFGKNDISNESQNLNLEEMTNEEFDEKKYNEEMNKITPQKDDMIVIRDNIFEELENELYENANYDISQEISEKNDDALISLIQKLNDEDNLNPEMIRYIALNIQNDSVFFNSLNKLEEAGADLKQLVSDRGVGNQGFWNNIAELEQKNIVDKEMLEDALHNSPVDFWANAHKANTFNKEMFQSAIEGGNINEISCFWKFANKYSSLINSNILNTLKDNISTQYFFLGEDNLQRLNDVSWLSLYPKFLSEMLEKQGPKVFENLAQLKNAEWMNRKEFINTMQILVKNMPSYFMENAKSFEKQSWFNDEIMIEAVASDPKYFWDNIDSLVTADWIKTSGTMEKVFYRVMKADKYKASMNAWKSILFVDQATEKLIVKELQWNEAELITAKVACAIREVFKILKSMIDNKSN